MPKRITIKPKLVSFLVALAPLALSLPAAPQIKQVPTDQPLICLTFDDGPVPGATEQILDILESEGVKGTFFLVGKKVAQHPEIVRRILSEGHELGNHSFTHSHLPQLESVEAIREEIAGTEAIIEESSGMRPKLFRAPYFDMDDRVHAVAADLGLPCINASVFARDTQKGITADDIRQNVLQSPKPGDIVLMHDWQAASREALPLIIRDLKERSFRMVTVSELLTVRRDVSE